MIVQTEHKIFSSFCEWFEHHLLQDLQGFYNYSSPVYPVEDNRLSQDTFSAPFYQWVYDSSVSGANIPTASGLGVPYIDYMNGRTIGAQPSGNVNYTLKDFNIYKTTQSDAKLLLDSKFNLKPNPRTNPPVSGQAPYQVLAPCIFLKPENMSSQPFTFGGGIKEKINFSAIIVSDDEFKGFGVGAFFNKKKNCIFPYFDEEPLNYYGDYKSGVQYNYKNKVIANDTPARHVNIDVIDYSPVEIDSLTRENPGLFFSRIGFQCSYYTESNLRIY